MRGVGIEGHVADQAKPGMACLERTRGTLEQALGIPGFARVQAFQVAFDGGKKRQRRNAKLDALVGHAEQAIDAQALHAWHGRHVPARDPRHR